MKDPLISYLHDHLCGSHFAVRLLSSLADQYKDRDLGSFAFHLCAEIQHDQAVLEELIVQVGTGHFDIAEAAGWLAEKASEIKLRDDQPAVGLGAFEALETLLLGIRGKQALWQALPLIRDEDARIMPLDFENLAARAADQAQRVDLQRKLLIIDTFGAKPLAA